MPVHTRYLTALAVVVLAVAAIALLSMKAGDPAESAPASAAAAPVGDLPGWRQVFVDDFTQDVASWGDCGTYEEHTCPSLPEPYRSKWWAYPSSHQDTREKLTGDGGFYEPRNLSMSDGMLHLRLRREDGTTQSAAPYPRLPAQTYGRFAIRFRVEATPGFKIAWLLWRTTSSWGEIDFPEADLDGDIHAFNHGETGQEGFASGVPVAGGWHTTVIEWTPDGIRFLLDDKLVGTATDNVPSTPMNWVIQSETTLQGEPPEDGAEATIDVDWVAAWAPA